MKYTLSYDDEYLDMCIVGSPFDEETAKHVLKEAVTERLVELNIIMYGGYFGGYKDRYQIVDFT